MSINAIGATTPWWAAQASGSNAVTADAAAAWRNVESDLHSGRLAKITVKWPVVFRVASRLVEGHSMTIGTRSLDLLHIAAAKAGRAVEFLSFDARQRALAALVGLRLAP